MFKNIFANVIGKFWSIVSNFLFLPFYIKYLGIENYSVISFSLIIIGVLAIMDAGMTSTLAREFARSLDPIYRKKVLDTLELCYFAVVILVMVSVCLFANVIVNKWINLVSLSSEEVASAIRIFAFVVSFQFISNFYIGGFIGLQQQVKANLYQIIWGIFKNALVIIVIYFYPFLSYYFGWQVIVTLVYVIFLRYSLLKLIHVDNGFFSKIFFDFEIFKNIKKFATGMLLISIVAAINTQFDRITISKLLPINELGYYNLAIMLSMAIVYFVTPISVALLPKFSFYAAQNEQARLNRLFDLAFSHMVAIVAVASAVMAIFGTEIIYIWTGDHALANASSSYILYSALGSSMLAMQVIPFDLAIANGNTRINNYLGIISMFFVIPCYWLSVKFFGPKGAALTWCISQVIITPIYLYLIQTKYLQDKVFFKMIFKEIIFKMGMAYFLAFLLWMLVPVFEDRIISFAKVVIVGLVILAIIYFITLRKKFVLFKSELKSEI